MNRKFIFTIILVVINGWLYAQYTTPGNGVTWNLNDLVANAAGAITFNGTSYTVHSDITIAATDTLRQTQDALIQVEPAVLITTLGVLQFSAGDLITIKASDTTQHFKGFRFESSDHSYFEKCLIEFGGGIKLINSDVRIEDCTIRKFNKSNCTGTIDLFESSPQILQCDIYLNQGPAVLSAANAESSPLIIGNWIYRNNTDNTNMPQVNLGTSESGTNIIIRDNTIEGFYDKAGGIAVSTLAGGFLNCIIDSNYIVNNRYGITLYGFNINSVISNNTLADNNIENMPMQGGSGINLWGGTSNVSMIYGNEIYGNLWGITNTGDAMPNLGQVEPDTINPGKNIIYDNGNLGTVYALYNNTPNNIFAENNYWGTYHPDSIEAVIFHYPDDENLGLVDYVPFKDYMTGVIEQSRFTAPTLVVFPNPATSSITLEVEHKGTLSLYNSAGAIVFKTAVSPRTPVDISTLRNGVYFTLFTNDYVTLPGKFYKK